MRRLQDVGDRAWRVGRDWRRRGRGAEQAAPGLVGARRLGLQPENLPLGDVPVALGHGCTPGASGRVGRGRADLAYPGPWLYQPPWSARAARSKLTAAAAWVAPSCLVTQPVLSLRTYAHSLRLILTSLRAWIACMAVDADFCPGNRSASPRKPCERRTTASRSGARRGASTVCSRPQ